MVPPAPRHDGVQNFGVLFGGLCCSFQGFGFRGLGPDHLAVGIFRGGFYGTGLGLRLENYERTDWLSGAITSVRLS